MKLQRSAVILIENNSVALIRRENERGIYYVFPGGGVEEHESLEEAAIIESFEELGVRDSFREADFKSDIWSE